MHKTRTLLGFLSLGLAAVHLFVALNGWSVYPAGIILHVFGGIMLASALVILAFSFLRVEASADGSLRYDPTNPYWKLMLRFYGVAWGERVTLCGAFWATFVILMVALLFGGMLLSLTVTLLYIGYAAVSEPVLFKQRMTSAELAPLLVMVGILVSFGLLQRAIVRKMQKKKYGVHAVAGAAASCATVALAMTQHTPIGGFVVGILSLIAALAATILIIFPVVIAAFKLVTALKDTWLSRALAAAKDKACPILVAAPQNPAENG